MNIQLPNLDINIDEGLDNKEMLQQILDAIHKQRKELNFYLMNLNEDNMPTIAGRMEDIEGNISLIDQNIDEILLLVANNAGDIASLSVRADQIQAQVSNNAGDIAALSVRADEIEATVADNAGNISSLQQTATSLTSRISNAEGNISQLQQTANSIISRVSYLEDDFDWAYSEITQLADEITAKVTIGDVVNYLSINRSGVQIHANNIDLTGITSIHSPRYPDDDYFTFYGNGVSLYVNGARRLEIFYDGLTNVFTGYDIDFVDGVRFTGDVDFSYANVYGLDTDVDMSYIIECYYSANNVI